MAANLNSELVIGPHLVYQDEDRASIFHYLTTQLDLTLEAGLHDLSITYWGIGEEFTVQDEGRFLNQVGVVIAGRSAPAASNVHQQQVITTLRDDFQITSPQASPIRLARLKARPHLGMYRWGIGGDGDQVFPAPLEVDEGFSFLAGWKCSFAQFTGTQVDDAMIEPHSLFGIGLVGEAEFTGDPWGVRVSTDLSRVWSQVRGSVEREISFEWHRLRHQEYCQLLDRLIDQGLIELTFLAGTFDHRRYGRQILEMGMRVLEAVNGAGSSKNGYIFFEPRAVAKSEDDSEVRSPWPWSLTINLAFGDQSIPSTPSTHYVETISFATVFSLPLPVQLMMAVPCSAQTASHFRDLGDPAEGCVTSVKAEKLSERMARERKRKSEAAGRFYQLLTEGRIGQHDYEAKMSHLYLL